MPARPDTHCTACRTLPGSPVAAARPPRAGARSGPRTARTQTKTRRWLRWPCHPPGPRAPAVQGRRSVFWLRKLSCAPHMRSTCWLAPAELARSSSGESVHSIRVQPLTSQMGLLPPPMVLLGLHCASKTLLRRSGQGRAGEQRGRVSSGERTPPTHPCIWDVAACRHGRTSAQSRSLCSGKPRPPASWGSSLQEGGQEQGRCPQG